MEVVSGAGLWQCYADKSELQTVLLNLAINAQQAIQVQVQVQGKLTFEVFNTRIDDDYAHAHFQVKPGQYVCFAVTDNGAGMTPEVAAQAFDPFFTTKEVGQGSGLGLSMAYGFAKQSGRHIKIYSEIEQGTTVKLYLPRSKVNNSERVRESVNLRTDMLQGISVLIVENDDTLRETINAQFISFGCHTVSVSTAAEAISIISSGESFDLQLLDVVLGHDKSGPDCAKVIERILPDIRTVFMSGYTENAIIHGGQLDAGVIPILAVAHKNSGRPVNFADF